MMTGNEPEWLSLLDEDRVEILRQRLPVATLFPADEAPCEIPNWHLVNPERELLMQIIRELKRGK